MWSEMKFHLNKISSFKMTYVVKESSVIQEDKKVSIF
jgi:hypothetical protein